MKRTEKGYTPAPGFFAEAVSQIPDMHREDFPAWELVELSPLLDSSDMGLAEWNKIASVVYENYDRYDGFVVLHGTDTMAYTPSAISLLF